MPSYFWDWYRSKGYHKIINEESCFESKAFLISCCTEYLTEKGQTLNDLHSHKTIEDICRYLITGVVWTGGQKC